MLKFKNKQSFASCHCKWQRRQDSEHQRISNFQCLMRLALTLALTSDRLTLDRVTAYQLGNESRQQQQHAVAETGGFHGNTFAMARNLH